jgi:hypothetical protein
MSAPLVCIITDKIGSSKMNQPNLIATIPLPEPGFFYGPWVLLFVVPTGGSPLADLHGWHRGRSAAGEKGPMLTLKSQFVESGFKASHWMHLPADPE